MDWVDEIKARAEAASPGPWRWDGLYESELYDSNKHHVAYGFYDGYGGTGIEINDDNAIFIAESREDIPRLIAEVERLRAMREPDPETGLMPCGCGGKPVFIEFFDGFFDHERITCSECQIEFTTTSVGCGALLWNKAMGWRGDNES